MFVSEAEYKAWIDRHQAHLDGEVLQLYPSAILEPYTEVALWPRLYWRSQLCESHRLAPLDWVRPFDRTRGARRGGLHESSKAAFIAKVTSDVADYCASFPLLQFQFDRYVFRTVMGKSTAALRNGFD
eukprot:3315234-Heterocapsa_arctica.AAC.1